MTAPILGRRLSGVAFPRTGLASRRTGGGSLRTGGPRRPPGVASRLAVAVLLAATIVAVGEGVVVGHLATEAAVRDAVTRAEQDVSAAAARSGYSSDPAEEMASSLRHLSARADVRSTELVDGRGTDVTAAVQALPGDDLGVTVPVELEGRPAAVRVVLRGEPITDRAADLRRGCLIVLVLGSLLLVPLVFALGGLRLVGRYHRVVREARVDRLTGLGSRWAFEKDLVRHTEDARRGRTPLALTLVDVGGVEGVRDGHGHRRADALLTRAAEVVRNLRGGHRAYRVAGDGFAVIMPSTTAEQARSTTAGWPEQIAAEAAPLTADVGVCALGEYCPDAETLLIGAEARLDDARDRRRDGPPADRITDEDLWDLGRLSDTGPGR